MKPVLPKEEGQNPFDMINVFLGLIVLIFLISVFSGMGLGFITIITIALIFTIGIFINKNRRNESNDMEYASQMAHYNKLFKKIERN